VGHDERATACAANAADERTLEKRRVNLYEVVASYEAVRGMRKRGRYEPAAEPADGFFGSLRVVRTIGR